MKLDERARKASRALMEEVERTVDVPLSIPEPRPKRSARFFVLPVAGLAAAAAAVILALALTNSGLEQVETEPVLPAAEGQAPGTLVYSSWADFPGRLQPAFLATGASANTEHVYVFARDVNENGDSAIVRYRDGEILVSEPFEAAGAFVEAFDEVVLVATYDSDMVGPESSGELLWLDPEDLSVERTAEISGTVSQLTATPDFAFYATRFTDRIYSVDMQTGEAIGEIPVAGQVMELEAGFGGWVMVVTAPSVEARVHGFIDTDTMEYREYLFCGTQAGCEEQTATEFPLYQNDDVVFLGWPLAIRDGVVYQLQHQQEGSTHEVSLGDAFPYLPESGVQQLFGYSDTTPDSPDLYWVVSEGIAYHPAEPLMTAIPQPACPEGMNGASNWLVTGPADLWQIDLCANSVERIWNENDYLDIGLSLDPAVTGQQIESLEEVLDSDPRIEGYAPSYSCEPRESEDGSGEAAGDENSSTMTVPECEELSEFPSTYLITPTVTGIGPVSELGREIEGLPGVNDIAFYAPTVVISGTGWVSSGDASVFPSTIPRIQDGLVLLMSPDATDDEIQSVADMLTSDPTVTPYVESFEFIDQEETYRQFVELFSDEPNMVESVEPEDLPPMFVITPSTADHDALNDLRAMLVQMPGNWGVVLAN